MKRREVILGKSIAMVVLIATIITHNFIYQLPYVLATSLITFSITLFSLCTIGDLRRKNQKESSKQKDNI